MHCPCGRVRVVECVRKHRLHRVADLRSVSIPPNLDLLTGPKTKNDSDRDSADPIVLLAVNQIRHQADWQQHHVRPIAVVVCALSRYRIDVAAHHRGPPLAIERLRPKSNHCITRSKPQEQMLEESIKLVLSVENAVETDCRNDGERQAPSQITLAH